MIWVAAGTTNKTEHVLQKPVTCFLSVIVAPLARLNRYDGIEEFYVIVREKGSREQEESKEEIKRKQGSLQAGGRWAQKLYI